MRGRIVGREADTRAVVDLLSTIEVGPAALLLEGEPGIGKTTVWLEGIELAEERGQKVLSARAAQAESVMAHATLTDLLTDVESSTWASLPEPQRRALDRVSSHGDAAETPIDPQTIGAAFLAVLEVIARIVPVLLAVDDVQWVDVSSLHVLAFAARRWRGRIGLLATVRTAGEDAGTASWLQLHRPEAIIRRRLGPMSVGGLQNIIADRLGVTFARPSMMRIYETSGANPFYALELARAMQSDGDGMQRLPGTLAELVHSRVADIAPGAKQLLLATACGGTLTVELLAAVVEIDTADVMSLLEEPERKGIIHIVGHAVQFTHPLLARGLYVDAAAGDRRAMHRRLADITHEPELHARHLALAATIPDPDTLASLDAAAAVAHRRGAPAAAAELLELAMGLGDDTPVRKISAAGHHIASGNPVRARELLQDSVATIGPGSLRAQALAMLGSVSGWDDSFDEAVTILDRALTDAGSDVAVRTQVSLTAAFAMYNTGDFESASANADRAVQDAEQLGHSDLLSQALGMRAVIQFALGRGVDEAGLQRAVDLQDRDADTPIPLRADMHRAQLLSWSGQLDYAVDELRRLRLVCADGGRETEIMLVSVQIFLAEIWRANYGAAARVADDAMERAQQLGGDVPLCVAESMQAGIAAFAGRADEARMHAAEGVAASRRCGSPMLADAPLTFLAFTEVSLGNHQAAVDAIGSLLFDVDDRPKGSEMVTSLYVPDGIEALIHLGRLADAEPLIDRLERNGARIDRAWMLAVGARCRGLLMAATGDVAGAAAVVERAMREHDRVAMPFERARTQLVLGQLQRRLRNKLAAATNLREASSTFEELDVPLWAARARGELSRVDVGPRQGAVLTPTERRIAELVGNGMTNRDVAATMFISPKTVEVNLTRIYRKFGIRSRAELGRVIDAAGDQ